MRHSFTLHPLLLGLGLACTTGCLIDDGELPEVEETPFELDWELDDDLEAAEEVCPPEDPDCDAIEDPDTVEEVWEDGDEGEPGSDPMGLTNPLTSSGKYRVWPNGVIPYTFDKDSNGNIKLSKATRDLLSQAMTSWQTKTENRVKFRAKKSTDTSWVVVKVGSPMVRPFVGYKANSKQELYLRNSEYITVVRHELGHVLGLHHEQKRKDRLSHIQVKTNNIVGTNLCQSQFAACSGCELVGGYNLGSVMHYRTKDLPGCRINEKPVLLKKDGSSINHAWNLTVKDLNAVAALYDGTTTTSPSSGPNPDNGSLTANGLCADVAGGSTAEGAKVLQWNCHGGDNQDWRATKNRQLKVKHSLRCAAVVGPSAPGATVNQATCSATADRQKWKFPKMEIVNGKTGKCFSIPNGNYFSGQEVRYASCNGSAAQKFAYLPHTEEIKAGGYCLTPKGGALAGNDVILRPCDGRTSQKWFQARGGFVNRADTGKCMRVEGGATSGTRIEVWDCNDADGQRWGLRGAVRDFRGNLCLRGGSSPGAPLELASCNGSNAQNWTFWSR